MTRFDAFEVYLKPEEQKKPQRSLREAQFDHWRRRGEAKSWEDCERLWQKYGLDKLTHAYSGGSSGGSG